MKTTGIIKNYCENKGSVTLPLEDYEKLVQIKKYFDWINEDESNVVLSKYEPTCGFEVIYLKTNSVINEIKKKSEETKEFYIKNLQENKNAKELSEMLQLRLASKDRNIERLEARLHSRRNLFWHIVNLIKTIRLTSAP